MRSSFILAILISVFNNIIVNAQDDCLAYTSLYIEFFKRQEYGSSYTMWRKSYDECSNNIKSKNFFVMGQKLLYMKIEEHKSNTEHLNFYKYLLKSLVDKRLTYYPEDVTLVNQVISNYNLDTLSNNAAYTDSKYEAKMLNNKESLGMWGFLTNEEGSMRILKNNHESFDIFFSDGRIWNFQGGLNKYTCKTSTKEGFLTVSAEFVTPKMIKIKEVRTSAGFMGSVSGEKLYYMVKDLRDKMELPVTELHKYDLIYRYDIKSGKIGEDYIPITYGTYNHGKKFYLGGIEVQEKDIRTYIKEGGYNRDVMGHAYVFQMINPTNKIYKINYSTGGHGKFPKTEKSYFVGIDMGYKTIDEHLNYESKNYIVLRPNETFKNQIILGTTIPIDFEFVIDEVVELKQNWLNELDAALKTTKDLALIDKYLLDVMASDWHDELIRNKNRIGISEKTTFFNEHLPLIESSVRPVNDLLFDKDFESEIIYVITNNSDVNIQITYSICNEAATIVATIASHSQLVGRSKIRGYSKESLEIKVIGMEKK